mgnify:CR=1 FL=1
MHTYEHSVLLSADKCIGCTTCVRHCPTEAIRIREGRAVINESRCIDCGECIRVCPHKAKRAIHDSFSDLEKYKYRIALPAPALYAQFDNLDDIGYVISGLLSIGFDDVFEVARAAEIVSYAISKTLREENRPRPVISSACPAVLRLIQVHFPALLDNVIDFISPMEAAAKIAP